MGINLTDEMAAQVNKAREDGVPCLLGTTSAKGEPDIAVRGSMMVFDSEHLAYWERSRNESFANLEENAEVVVFYRNPETRAQLRFYGAARVCRQGDEVREKIMSRVVQPELDADPQRLGMGVLIRVNRVRQGSNVIMERQSAAELAVIEAVSEAERRLEEANKSADEGALDALLSADFRYTGGNSTSMSRREWILTLSSRRLTQQAKTDEAKTYERAKEHDRSTVLLLTGLRVGQSTEYGVEVHGDVAIANRRYTILEADGSERCLRYVRIYRHEGEDWRLASHRYVHAVD